MAQTSGELVHSLPALPVHLFQHTSDPQAYNNPMGCGAFTTAMALSCYDPRRYGTYDVARMFFGRMLKVPFAGGTFESQNAVIARRQGYKATPYDHGTIAELMATIDAGAPAVLLINPTTFGIGTHDVLLVGYSVNAAGQPQKVFIDNPAQQEGTQPGTNYPGNQAIAVADLPQRWTGVFTPFFSSDAQQAEWLKKTGRSLPTFGLADLLGIFG